MNLIKAADRYFHTVRFLKPQQIFYRVKYALIPVKCIKKVHFEGTVNKDFKLLPLPSSTNVLSVDSGRFTFRLLNLQKTFHEHVNWNDQGYGRLWNYHLQYADFLKQNDLPKTIREELLVDLYRWLYDGTLLPEPYPASLRIMNAIHFLCSFPDSSQNHLSITDGIYSELHFLRSRIEYHLSGNHLLENAFALSLGGMYFNHTQWAQFASELLLNALDEQILEDGAHVERSPMYHQLLLSRVLEALSYVPSESELYKVLRTTAVKMVSWIQHMTFRNGSTAHVNDSTGDVSYSTNELVELARLCGLDTNTERNLSSSGFRRFDTSSIELIADVAGIKPNHQPGHSHADSLSFIMHAHGEPVIIDPGISTYEAGQRRILERSTKFHNTVTVNDQSSADVWSVFRVARRPVVSILDETNDSLSAMLTYVPASGERFEHKRRFNIHENDVELADEVNSDEPAAGRFHFAPGIQIVNITGRDVLLSNKTILSFTGIDLVTDFNYLYNSGFNRQIKCRGLMYQFLKNCSVKITSGIP